MNWTGGARSRICRSGDRKTQKEFFEQKRLMSSLRKNHLRGTHTEKYTDRLHSTKRRAKNGISQDIKALSTVNRACANQSDSKPPKTSVRRVEMDDSFPFVREKDLGPDVPYETPSRLLLMDSRSQSEKEKEKPLSLPTKANRFHSCTRDDDRLMPYNNTIRYDNDEE